MCVSVTERVAGTRKGIVPVPLPGRPRSARARPEGRRLPPSTHLTMSKLAASLALLSQLVLGLSSTSGGSPVDASGILGGAGFLEAAAPGLAVVATLPTFDAAPRLLARLASAAGGVCPRKVTEGPGSPFQDETLARWARLERENPHREPSPLLGHRCRARGS